MNTITIELGENTQKLLERIDKTLTELLCETRVNIDTPELIRLAVTNAGTPFPAVPAEPQAAPEPVAEAEPTPEPEKPAEVQKAAEEDVPKAFALVREVELRASLQKKVVDLSTAGKKDAVKAVVQAYAPRVSAIPEDKLAEVLAKLNELEG